MTPTQANQEVQISIDTKLNEAIRQAASQGKKSFIFDFGPWPSDQQNQAKKALEALGYRVDKAFEILKITAPSACEISWT